MNKELRVRMLAKTERHRISRIAWRKFLRKNPNADENTYRSIDVALTRQNVSATRFKNVFSQKSSPITSIFRSLKSKITSIFRRNG